MEFQNMGIQLNKNKAIGKVLFIVEGGWTEPYILRKIFTTIFDYQYETILRDKPYRLYNSKVNPYSQVFVINAEESNIKYIDKDNNFLNMLFASLIEEYDFDVDNAAIYYLFDRDNQSNTDRAFFEDLIKRLGNSRDNLGYDRQGLLLLSYPSVESFTISNFILDSSSVGLSTGTDAKHYAKEHNINPQKLSEQSLCLAVKELYTALAGIDIDKIDLDDFSNTNFHVFNYEEDEYSKSQTYKLISLVAIALLDLELIEEVE